MKNTSLDFINGTFDNLGQGQHVWLSYRGIPYDFVANYYGGSGNDLVLTWANNRTFAWGANYSGALGDNTGAQGLVPVPMDMTPGVSELYGKTVVGISAGQLHSLMLCSDGTVAACGDATDGSMTYHNLALVAAPLPPLNLKVQQGAGTLTLQWPINYSSFVPQANSALANPAGWTDLTELPVLGTNCSLTLPSTNTANFFRLRSP